MVVVWCLVFVAALALMIKSADWLLEKSEKLGLALGISPFIVGVTIVGAGTSFPELVAGLMAVWEGTTEIVVANALGSNVANIFLVTGLAVVVARKLTVTKSLIDLDLPLLAASTALMMAILWDRVVVLPEAIILLTAYIVYMTYTMTGKEKENADIETAGDLPDIIGTDTKSEARKKIATKTKNGLFVKRPKIQGIDMAFLLMGVAGLFVGSKYLVQSVVELSLILRISAGLLAISVVALGTSLPELIVSIKAARAGKAEIAIGNIFGSNVFNLLLVVGLPGLLAPLQVDERTYAIGMPAMVIATLLFIISGISKKIYIWEGLMYVILYITFIGKLFGLL